MLALADAHAALDGATLEVVEPRYAEARELGRARSMRPVVAGSHLGLGGFLRRIGQAEVADAHLASAARLFAEMGLVAVKAHVATTG